MDSRIFDPRSIDGALTPEDLITHCDTCQESHINETRDIVMFIDGSCSGNGTENAKAGIGVYIHCNPAINISRPLQSGPQTSQRAEIHAAIAALKHARKLLRKGKFRVWDGIVLASDSAYVVNAMTSWIYKWNRNGWKTSSRKPVANEGDFKELEEHVLYLERNRVRVRFWKVDREFNTEADELARRAAASVSN